MLDFSQTNIVRLAITWSGNKERNEGIVVPKTTLVPINDFAHQVLLNAFCKPFEKTEEFFTFHDVFYGLRLGPDIHNLKKCLGIRIPLLHRNILSIESFDFRADDLIHILYGLGWQDLLEFNKSILIEKLNIFYLKIYRWVIYLLLWKIL